MEYISKKTSPLSIVVSISILTIFSWFALQPLSWAGFFPMHDDTQVARVAVMENALGEGQFPVRWVSDLGYGYGYPIYNFYGPLPYYVGSIFTHFGFSALVATKIMFGIGVLLLGWTTYALVASFWGSIAGLTSAVLAMYAPYHAVQVYVRGAVGEFWASAFIPVVILGFLLVRSARSRLNGVLLGSIGLAAVILSHTLSGFVAIISCFVILFGHVAYAFVRKSSLDRNVFLAHVAIVSFGLGLSAFFWLPAFTEMQFTSVAGQIGNSASYKDHFVCLSQFWNSPWGYGGSTPGCVDGLSFKLGKVHILLGLIGLLLWNRSKKINHNALYLVAIGLIVGGVVFATTISTPLWSVLPQFAYIQYPWRFITVIELGLSMLVASLVLQKSQVLSGVIAMGVIVLTMWNNAYLFVPQYSYPRADTAFVTKEEIRFRVSKISDEYLPSAVRRPTSLNEVVFDTIEATGAALVTKVRDEATHAVYRVSSEQSFNIRINKAYFPGWRYWVNNVEVYPKIIHGLPNIMLPAGSAEITIRFVDTPVRTAGNVLTVCFVFALFFYYGKSKKTIT